jgi:hypothetical protein
VSAHALTNDYAAHFVRRGPAIDSAAARVGTGLVYLPCVSRRDEGAKLEHPSRDRVKSRVVSPRATAVPVRLTLGERDQLADTARDLGISISTYIRQVVLSRPLPPRRAVRPIPEVNRETYHELGRVGGQLNQIAQRLNARRAEDGAADLLEVLQSVAQLLSAVRVEVLGVNGGGGA